MKTTVVDQRIGVFDSGVGGLTVLNALAKAVPQESILYFGDTARLPYGTRTPEEILCFVREILTWMTANGVKMVVMACNTSSALALQQVREEFDLPILGLIQPGAQAAAAQGKQIGVIATPATAKSHAYRQEVLALNRQARVWEVGCPAFVPLIEQNRIHDPETEAIAREYLAPLMAQGIDSLIYGCTHYPHLEPVLRRFLPKQIRLVDPADAVATVVRQILGEQHYPASFVSQPTRFCVSGCPSQFSQISAQWLGYQPLVEQVDLAALVQNVA